MNQLDPAFYMQKALKLAKKAARLGEVPVGAVVVAMTHEGPRIVGTGFNCRETRFDPAGHAELVAIRKAAKKLKAWRLSDCILYVTLEPCMMCAGSIVLSRLSKVVYGARDPKAGAVESLYSALNNPRLNHRPDVRGGVLEEECGKVLKDFFRERRLKAKHEPKSINHRHLL